jgi:hypothetical protein
MRTRWLKKPNELPTMTINFPLIKFVFHEFRLIYKKNSQ